jgi:hypothetical protein
VVFSETGYILLAIRQFRKGQQNSGQRDAKMTKLNNGDLNTGIAL